MAEHADATRPGSPTRDLDVADVADVFALLGDQGRVRILIELLEGPMRVRDLAGAVGLSESGVSHALRLLRAHRVVSVERNGREAHYDLADTHVRELLTLALDHAGHSSVLHIEHDQAAMPSRKTP